MRREVPEHLRLAVDAAPVRDAVRPADNVPGRMSLAGEGVRPARSRGRVL